MGSTPKNAMALPMLAMLTVYWFEGTFYPVGGSQALADALYNRFVEAGGTAVFNRAVMRIQRETSTKVVVELVERSGAYRNVAQSSSLIFNGSEFLLAELMGAPDDERRRLRKRYKPARGILVLYLGLKRTLPHIRGIYYSSTEMREDDVLVMGNPTHHDPSLARKGKGMLIAYAMWPHEWCDVTDWDGEKKRVVASELERLYRRFPELRDEVELVEAASPATLVKYTQNTD